MTAVHLVLVSTILLLVASAAVSGTANGALLLAGILVALLALMLRGGASDCDCPVDHSEALLDDEQTAD